MKLKFIGKGDMPHTFTGVPELTVGFARSEFVVRENVPANILEITIDGKMIVELDEQGVISVRQ